MGLQHFLVLLNTFLKENAAFFPNMANCHRDKTWLILSEKKRHTTHQGIAHSDTQVFERAMPLMYIF